MIHGLRDFRDPDQTLLTQVEFLFHHAHDRRKLPKLIGFCRFQWVFLEERDNSV